MPVHGRRGGLSRAARLREAPRDLRDLYAGRALGSARAGRREHRPAVLRPKSLHLDQVDRLRSGDERRWLHRSGSGIGVLRQSADAVVRVHRHLEPLTRGNRPMTRSIKVAAVSLGLVLGAFGCGSFLTGDKLSSDPNNPSQATADQLFVGVQANMFTSQENTVAMTVCMWMQQCAGVGGRFVDQYGHYVVNEFSWDGNWFQVYTGGGLIDLRKIEAAERTAGDSVFLGIAKVWEAFDMGVAADLWGDVPYSETAGSNPTPALDSQASVYAAVQTLLSEAIVELGGPGAGPRGGDLVYAG